jgi:protein phosphatase 1 regulatory subunit 11
VGESSSEGDSSSGSDSGNGSDSGVDDGVARMVGGGSGRRRRRRRRGHRHEHDDDCGDKSVKGRRRPSPNAYEMMPKSSVKRDLKR